MAGLTFRGLESSREMLREFATMHARGQAVLIDAALRLAKAHPEEFAVILAEIDPVPTAPVEQPTRTPGSTWTRAEVELFLSAYGSPAAAARAAGVSRQRFGELMALWGVSEEKKTPVP